MIQDRDSTQGSDAECPMAASKPSPDRPGDAAAPASADSAARPDAAARRAARLATPRLQREARTVSVMSAMYCRDHHGDVPRDAEGLCPDCARLREYARKRLALCPYGADKPTCANCQIHCYGAKQREATRELMRYAGPRMLLRHPVLAIAHVIDGRRPAPPKPNAARSEPGSDAD